MRILLSFLAIVLLLACGGDTKVSSWSFSSPDDNLSVNLVLENGKLYYTLSADGQVVIDKSALGMVLSEGDFSEGLAVVKADPVQTIQQKYTLKTGKHLNIEETGNTFSATFRNANGTNMRVDWQVYDTGAAFRYGFEGAGEAVTVEKDLSEFNLAQGGTAWLQPYDTIRMYGPAYERYYQEFKIGDPSPLPAGWVFPALFETAGHWVLISEGGLQANYVGLHLQPEAPGGKYTIRFPEATERNTFEANPTITLPFNTAWKTIAVSTEMNDIINSDLVTHVSDPSTLSDDSWIQPGVSSWSWLSDHDSPQNYGDMTPFIDLSADMGWPYFLVDANWERMNGGNINQLIDYAKNKGVDILMWYNSGGPHNVVTEGPRDIMNDPQRRKEAFAKLRDWGVKGVKIDFFQSDKQEIIQLYHDILKDAGDAQIMVNFHGCTMPRGWARTYPHLMSMEAVRGAECYSFEPGYELRAPAQNVILSYTRNVVGSMDYTPVIFTERENPHLTSYGHELALSVLYESGIFHMGDAVEGYRALDIVTQRFLMELPTVWDETLYLQGRPGKDAVLARRNGDTWYIGGINGEDLAKDWTINLDFTGKQNSLLLIPDGANNKSLTPVRMDPQSQVEVKVLPYGGFVIRVD